MREFYSFVPLHPFLSQYHTILGTCSISTDADWRFSFFFCKAALDRLAAHGTGKAVLLEIVLACSPLGVAPNNLPIAC